MSSSERKMKPGGWLDALLFAAAATASAWGAMSWDARRSTSPNVYMYLVEAMGVGGVVTLLGAGIYQAAQRRRLRAGVLSPRRAGSVISACLGMIFSALWLLGGRVLDPTLGVLGYLALACVLPWVLSRAQWTAKGRADDGGDAEGG